MSLLYKSPVVCVEAFSNKFIMIMINGWRISTFLYFYISTPRTDDAYDLLSLDDLDLPGQRDS